MKKMEEHEVLHLGNTIADWRTIAGCIRNTAKACGALEREQLKYLALRIEAHLPSNNPSTSQE